jgi:predicted transcriptional regulator
MQMTLTLSPELEAALNATASQRGVAPEMLALAALRERFMGTAAALEPRDEWERGLLAAARECGVSLPNSALSSEALYD